MALSRVKGMRARGRAAWAVVAFMMSPSALAGDYFVSADGNDANPGTEARPWRTIARVNAVDLQPGDRVQFRAGDVFSGLLYLDPYDGGTPDQPVTVTSYGSGRAVIHGGSGSALHAYGCGGIEIRNLGFQGSGAASNSGAGLAFWTDRDDADVVHLVIDQVEVSGFGDVGVYFGSNSTKFKGFRHVRVIRTDVHHNGRDGMFTWGTYTKRASDPYSNKDFYVGHCRFFGNTGIRNRNTGNGMYLKDVQGAIVEYCEAFDNGSIGGLENGGGPVGIWTLQSDQITIRFCQSHHNQSGGTRDGGGFDLDGGVTNSEMYGNYSHDNEGPGILVIDDRSWARPNRNNKIHDNISENDGYGYAGSVYLWAASGSSIQNLDLYQNVIFTGNGPAAVCVRQSGRAGTNIRICNNIFYSTQSRSLLKFDKGDGFLFLGNDYYARDGGFQIVWVGTSYASLSAWAQATGREVHDGSVQGFAVDPMLEGPGSGGSVADLLLLEAYRLEQGSPLRDTGFEIDTKLGIARGPFDFFGTPLAQVAAWDVGANETGEEPAFHLSAPVRAQTDSLVTLAAQNRADDSILFLTLASPVGCDGPQSFPLWFESLSPQSFSRASYFVPAGLAETTMFLTTYSTRPGNNSPIERTCSSVLVQDF